MSLGLGQYVRSRREEIEGWFARADAELFRVILEAQVAHEWRGGVAEIGVHHGKSFIAMCMGLAPGEKAYCIDIFENQALNRDGSGKGDRAIFEEHLARFGVPSSKVVIRTESSLEVRSEEIVEAVGAVRLFSVDGGHWFGAVKNDLALAEASLAPYGVIALDDFLRPEWPDVSAGYFAWKAQASRPLVPFAMGFNKLYLCDAAYLRLYQAAVRNDPLLGGLVVRWVELDRVSLPVFSELPLPEHSRLRRWRIHTRNSRPETYLAWEGLVRRVRASLGAIKHAIRPARSAPLSGLPSSRSQLDHHAAETDRCA